MTLTTMGCPLADLPRQSIYDALTGMEEVTKVVMWKLVWYQAWTRFEKMSRYARIALGISKIVLREGNVPLFF